MSDQQLLLQTSDCLQGLHCITQLYDQLMTAERHLNSWDSP